MGCDWGDDGGAGASITGRDPKWVVIGLDVGWLLTMQGTLGKNYTKKNNPLGIINNSGVLPIDLPECAIGFN